MIFYVLGISIMCTVIGYFTQEYETNKKLHDFNVALDSLKQRLERIEREE